MLPLTPVLPQTLALSAQACHFFITPALPENSRPNCLHNNHAVLDFAWSSHK
jgi:hypothetical protein